MNKLFFSVPIKEQILFTRNLAIMSQSGMPLLEGLHMMQKQTRNNSMRKILASVIINVENGQFLSTSLKKYESIFGSLFINIIQIGETGGVLAENLAYLSEELKKKQQLRSKIFGALAYPIIIVITTIALVAVLTFMVFPKILPIFKSFNVKLPISTRIVIGTNTFLLAKWPIILGLVIGLLVIGWLLSRIRAVKFAMHRSIIYVPVIGPFTRSVEMSILSRTFGLLMKSGVKIVEALLITADVMPNLAYKKAVQKAADQIKAGAPLGKYFESNPHLFPIMFSQMVEMSEAAGTLDTTLAYLGQYYEEELDEGTKNMVALLEPMLLLFMGGIVGFMAISIILPIYSISQTVNR